MCLTDVQSTVIRRMRGWKVFLIVDGRLESPFYGHLHYAPFKEDVKIPVKPSDDYFYMFERQESAERLIEEKCLGWALRGGDLIIRPVVMYQAKKGKFHFRGNIYVNAYMGKEIKICASST